MGKDYLRNRPFLIVTQFTIPSETARTEKRGWANKKEAVVVQESIEIVDSIQNKHMVGPALILDILKQKTIKNLVSPENDSEVIQHYLNKYKREIAEGVQLWMHKLSKNPEEAKQIVEDIEKDVKLNKDRKIYIKK